MTDDRPAEDPPSDSEAATGDRPSSESVEAAGTTDPADAARTPDAATDGDAGDGEESADDRRSDSDTAGVTPGDGAVLLVNDDHDREYLRRPGERLETDLGVLELPEAVMPGQRLETHLGEPFRVRRLRGPDLFAHLERTGAPMMPRDVGLVVGLAGVQSGDRVLDAGTGTGVLAALLGRIGADVVTYERDPEFAAQARENMQTAGVADRVEVRTADLLEELPDLSGFDVLTLDTEDAADAVARAPETLTAGGYAVAYCPFVEAARDVERAAREAGMAVETRETIQREMDFDDRGSRPTTAGVGHTGYLVVARRR